MYYLLKAYWEQTKLDDLGGLLGSMRPDLFSGGMPIDKKLVDDWEIITGESEDINEEEAFDYVIKFLEKQSEWLNIDSLILDLKSSIDFKKDYWLLCLQTIKEKGDNSV